MYDAIILGRGPLGVYTASTLIEKGMRVLNIDCGKNLNELRENQTVVSNFNWKSKQEAPSLNKNASDFMWNGGCMSVPVTQLGLDFPKIPINEKDYTESVDRVKKFLNIDDFDFLENRPNNSNNLNKRHKSRKDIRYTYILNDWSFESQIMYLESNNDYTYMDELTVFKFLPGDEIEIQCLQKDGSTISFSCKQLYLCLGAIENTRLLLNNNEKLQLQDKAVGLNLSDHLRLPVARVELSDIEAFKNLFDANQNILENNTILPRLVNEEHSIQSYAYFKMWRYNSLILRKFKLNFLKKKFKFSGTCEMFIFAEKPANNKTIIKISENNSIPEMIVSATIEENDINLFKDLANSYFEILNNNYGDFVKNIRHFKISNRDEYLETIYSANHPSGTTKMGTNSKESVVNNLSQIWGFNNIHVFGSSVFPRPFYIHPTFPAMVLADYSLNSK
tara:strand:+ start:2549 stop:3892 length:1344 start_codon:yes stop_codon:yes gene_type:complete